MKPRKKGEQVWKKKQILGGVFRDENGYVSWWEWMYREGGNTKF